MKYICTKCGQEHDGRPSIAFDSPYQYEKLDDEDKESIASLSDDLCVIRHDEQTDRFVRAVLHQKVNGDCQSLDYGVWVSLSERSFNDYLDNYDKDDYEATYFGFICNNLNGYANTLLIKSNVVLRGKIRPEIILHDDQLDKTATPNKDRKISNFILRENLKSAYTER